MQRKRFFYLLVVLTLLLSLLPIGAAAQEAKPTDPPPAAPEAAPDLAPLGPIGGYTFINIAPGAYADLTGDTPFVVNGGAGTLDDGISADQTIPFPFNFGGSVFTTYRVNSNGWLGFGSPTATGNYSALSGTVNNVIAFVSRDMNNTGAVYSNVTEGVAPNRVHKIQAKNFYRYNATTDTGNAQVWLYETSNVVEVHYGAFATWTNTSGTAQVGLRGGSSGTADVRSLTGAGTAAWQNVIAGNASGATVTLYGAIVPDSGRIYRFEPVLAPNLGASTKSAAQAYVFNGQTVDYQVVVRNSGDDTATGATLSDPIPAGSTYAVGSLATQGSPAATYNSGANAIEWGAADLAPGQAVTVTFQVNVTALSGANVVNTATIGATNVASPVVRTLTTPVVGCIDDASYLCADSAMIGGPSFNWYDATGGALILDAGAAVGDDREANVVLPFPFTFYGTTSSDIRVGDNGGILFGVTTGEVGFSNSAMSSAPANFIAPFWDDMDTDTGGTYGQVFGTAPNRVYVVEWSERPHFSNVGAGTFEVLFLEGTNQIVFQYQDVDFGNVLYDNGASATVGIKGSTIQYAYNVPVLETGLAIQFTPKAPAISLTKTVGTDPLACATTDDITVPAGSDVTYCYEVTNTGNLTLNLHDLADSELGNLFTGLSYALAPGASAFITDTTTINVTTVNTATWTAYNAGPIDVVTASDVATVTVVIVPNPAISLVKTVGTTPGVCAATDTISVAAGTTVYYCYVAENTGNVNLNFHSLVDNKLGALVNNLPYVLTPGAFSPEVIVPETINIGVTNVATWTATTMNFIDISATGTALNLTDDLEANITSPFPFTFFGVASSDLRVGNNGGILFGVTTGDLGLSNAALPAASGLPAPAILPFWDDLDDETGNVYWEVQGTAPNRVLIVQWHNRPHFNGVGAATFEVLLYETSNAIEFLYLDTDFGNPSYNFGASATSGLQESTSSAVQYSFNQAVLLNNMTIRFEPPAYTPVVTMAPTASASDSATVTALFPNIDVSPLSMSATQATNTTTNQPLNVGNTGAAPLTWEIAETEPDAAPRRGIEAAPEPVFTVPAVVASKADCAAFENYLGNEPEGWAEFCGQPGAASAHSPSSPSSTGYTLNLRTPNRNLYQFTLNNFPGQTSVGAQAANIYALDFDSSATTLYALNTSTNELGTLSTTTGAFTAIVACPAPAAGTWTGLSIDPVTNVFYASTAVNLYTVDPATCSPTLIGPFGVASGIMIDIAIGSAGVMYGHDIFTDSIYTIDTSTGAATLVGSTGFAANFAQGMDFDNEDGTLYIFLYIGTGANRYGTVDLATGAVTALATDNPLGEFEGATQTLGLCVPTDYGWLSLTPLSGTTAPAAVTQVDVTFDSTGLPVGVYNGQLCIRSNDPDAGPGNGTSLVQVPVTLTVTVPTAVTLSGLAASSEQAQAPLPLAGLPWAALTAAVGLALGAAYTLRRKS